MVCQFDGPQAGCIQVSPARQTSPPGLSKAALAHKHMGWAGSLSTPHKGPGEPASFPATVSPQSSAGARPQEPQWPAGLQVQLGSSGEGEDVGHQAARWALLAQRPDAH